MTVLIDINLCSSGSVQNNYASNIVPFVKSVINRYTE
jgi:hypothetical protein